MGKALFGSPIPECGEGSDAGARGLTRRPESLLDRRGLGAMAEDGPEIEAVAEAGGEDPRIDVGIADDIDAADGGGIAPRDRGVEPGLLDVGVERPTVAERHVNSRLQGKAPGVVDIDFGRADDIGASAGVEEIDV
jgi:hypothetical protein